MTALMSVCSTSASTSTCSRIAFRSTRASRRFRSIRSSSPFDVDLVQHGVQIDLVQQRIHIQRGNHKVDRTLRDGLGQRLPARDLSAVDRALSLKRIHRLSIPAPCEPWTTPKG